MSFPRLLPGPACVVDLDSPAPHTSSASLVVCVGSSDESDIETLRTQPQEPAFLRSCELPTCPRVRAVEEVALSILRKPAPPCKTEVLRLFAQLSGRDLKACSYGEYIVAGASPRSRTTCVTHTLKFPLFTRVVTKFLGSVCPQHVYTSFVIRRGCFHKVHRDIQNGPTGAAVVALSNTLPGEGLWVQDKLGNVLKEHNGEQVAGTVRSLHEPVIFDSRKLLHAGHMLQGSTTQRVILVAFSTLHASTMPWWPREQLLELGFRLPTHFQIRSATHGVSASGQPPRLKQLTLSEALNLTIRERDLHDVISVLGA